jgi:hypothetical protein
MAFLYKNAFVTVAASLSASAHECILWDRDVSHIRENHFQFAWSDSDGRSNCIRDGDHLKHDIRFLPRTEPLLTRGWALQGQLLSSDLLTLGAEEVRWSCKTRSTCQCGSSELRKDASLQRQNFRSREDASSHWQEIVEDYSSRELTHPLDKLTALSGVAEVYHKLIGSNYVAGLWESTLIHDLTWCGGHKPPPTPVDYIAPTLSWASVHLDHDCPLHTVSSLLQ